jgi:sporulation protein YlmC with PRC-barrel domain
VVFIAIEIISNRLKTVADLTNSKNLHSVVVISKSGEIVGRVRNLRTRGFNVEGIVISRPFSMFKQFIDKSFIKTFNQDQILLKINPVLSLRGLKVYDKSGRRLGKVRKVLRQDNGNNFTSFVVKDKFYSKSILIGKDNIGIMKKNIILNMDYDKESRTLRKR